MAGNDLRNKEKKVRSTTACPFGGAKLLIHDWAVCRIILFNPGKYFIVYRRKGAREGWREGWIGAFGSPDQGNDDDISTRSPSPLRPFYVSAYLSGFVEFQINVQDHKQ
jgi:hypothetical protein